MYAALPFTSDHGMLVIAQLHLVQEISVFNMSRSFKYLNINWRMQELPSRIEREMIQNKHIRIYETIQVSRRWDEVSRCLLYEASSPTTVDQHPRSIHFDTVPLMIGFGGCEFISRVVIIPFAEARYILAVDSTQPGIARTKNLSETDLR